MRPNLFWKIYFWFLVVVVGVFSGASLVQGLDMIKILDFPISLVGLAGLFGFAYQRKIGGEPPLEALASCGYCLGRVD